MAFHLAPLFSNGTLFEKLCFSFVCCLLYKRGNVTNTTRVDFFSKKATLLPLSCRSSLQMRKQMCCSITSKNNYLTVCIETFSVLHVVCVCLRCLQGGRGADRRNERATRVSRCCLTETRKECNYYFFFF